jgi:predicted alpha/beta-hydrolase family hydrolase
MSILFDDLNSDPAIHGYLHVPARPTGKAIVLTHGAGADCQSKLLVEMSNALGESGFTVLRFDLPFRRERPHGPPSPSNSVRDRDGLRRAVSIMREQKNSQVFWGRHSYGGRQATMLVSEEPQLADGLLVFSSASSASKTESTSYQPFPKADDADVLRSRHPRPIRHNC